MARKIKQKASVGAKAVKRRRTWKFDHVPCAARVLVEVGADDLRWRTNPELEDGDYRDSIVKLVPPPGTPEATVLAMERAFYAVGSATVKVMPVQDEVRINVGGEDIDPGEQSDDRSLRQVVMGRVDRATNPYDREALRALCTEAMDAAEGNS